MQSKGPSRVFSNTTVQKHQFFGSNEFRVERNTPRGQRAEFYSETCRNTEGYTVGGASVERDEGMESVRQEQGV